MRSWDGMLIKVDDHKEGIAACLMPVGSVLATSPYASGKQEYTSNMNTATCACTIYPDSAVNTLAETVKQLDSQRASRC